MMNNANCLTFKYNDIKGIQNNSKQLSVVEYCIISGSNTTQYFKLQKGARQGVQISAYIFI